MKLGEFVDRVCAHYGGDVREPKGGSLSGHIARGEALRLLVRTDAEGKYRVVPIPPEMTADTEVISLVLRSMCNQLGIDPADFGIGEEPTPEE